MADEAVLGVRSKLGLATSNSGSPPADPTFMLEYLSEDVRLVVNRANVSGIRGTRSLPGVREVVTSRAVAGAINLQPTPTELRTLLPWILGTAESGSGTSGTPWAYALAETVPAKDVFVLRGTQGFKNRECYVNRATFSADQGGPLSLTLDVVGKDRDDPPAANYTWPAIYEDEAARPWMMYECVLSINPNGSDPSANYKFRGFSLSVDNGLATDRFLNSVTPTEFPSAVREVRVGLTTPWGPFATPWIDWRTDRAAVTLTFTNGLNILTFTMPYVWSPAHADPSVRAKDEIMMPLDLVARADWDGTNHVVIPELATTISTS